MSTPDLEDPHVEKPESWMWVLLVLAPYIGVWFFFSGKYSDWRAEFIRTTAGRVTAGFVLFVSVVVLSGIANLASMTPEERARSADAAKARKAAKAERVQQKAAASKSSTANAGEKSGMPQQTAKSKVEGPIASASPCPYATSTLKTQVSNNRPRFEQRIWPKIENTKKTVSGEISRIGEFSLPFKKRYYVVLKEDEVSFNVYGPNDQILNLDEGSFVTVEGLIEGYDITFGDLTSLTLDPARFLNETTRLQNIKDAEPSPLSTKEFVGKVFQGRASYEEVVSGAESSLAASLKDVFPQVAGKRVQWSGRVGNVRSESNRMEGFVQLDADTLVDFVHVQLPKSQLSELKEGEVVTVEGLIHSVDPGGMLSGYAVVLDPAVLVAK